MTWTQNTDPLGNIALSAVAAVIPILFLFWALIIKKMKGYKASLLATVTALFVAITIYGMPVDLAFLSAGHGVLYGLFPICWIVITVVFLFNVTVKSGQFEIIKHFMASITDDRRLQALIIAFCFGSFLEGTAGFGAPVAITAAMLVGLGFNPLYAAGICLIANTAPVAFGAIGTPILVASQVSDIPDMAISQMVGRTLPILSFLVPLYLVVIMAGFRKAWEVWPAILVTGGSFAGLQWFSSNYLGPNLPDIISGLGATVCLVIFLKFWKPRHIWKFDHENQSGETTHKTYSTGQIVRAWSPFIILTIMVIGWGIAPIKVVLDQWGSLKFEIPGIHFAILDTEGNPMPHIFKFNYLSAAGTAILISAFISLPLIGYSMKQAGKVFVETLSQLKFPIITVGAVLGFAYVLNDSGMTISMAYVLASTGPLFPFFAPVLGWLGVFITGSDTSANALFGKLQSVTASSIGVDPVVAVGANVSGGVVGKMISPQSIAVAAGAGGLIGRESELFRFTVKHSFIMLFFVCCLVCLQAYLMAWIVPDYMLISHAQQQATNVADSSSGIMYLGVFTTILAIICAAISFSSKDEDLTPKKS